LAAAKHVTNGMIVASVRALAEYVTPAQLAKGLLYVPICVLRFSGFRCFGR
jgi:malic enzyme